MYNFPPYLGRESCNKNAITNISEIHFSSKNNCVIFAYKYVKTFHSQQLCDTVLSIQCKEVIAI